MDSADTLYHAPVLLRMLCDLAGMSFYLATMFWLGRLAYGYGNALTLRQICTVWFLRVLAACVIVSVAAMIYSGRMVERPSRALPEMAFILLLLAAYLLAVKRDAYGMAHILRSHLPLEMARVAGVGLCCILGLVVAGLLWRVFFAANLFFHGPEWVAPFAAGAIFLGPVIPLFQRARSRSGGAGLKFYPILWPLMLCCFFILLPDLTEHLANSPKVAEFLSSRGRLQRA